MGWRCGGWQICLLRPDAVLRGWAGASGGDIFTRMKGAFSAHPQARLFLGGRLVPDLGPLGMAFAGGPFRIGGAGAVQAGPGQFETLTSGSSGAARRIIRSVRSWTASFAVNAPLFGIAPGVQVAVLGGLEQSLALYASVEALSLGAGLHFLAGVRPDRQRLALADHQVEIVYATPAQLRLLAEAGGPVLPLRLIVVGGSKLDDSLRAALALLAPAATVHEFYGAAEASFITLAGPDMPHASVGTPYPGVQIDLRGAGDVGQIWVKSPYLFDGYAGDDPGGAVWDQGWLSVGEMGWMKAGHLYLAGRAGRMVTVADQNVFPEPIEAFLAALPGVDRAAVLPRPDAVRGVVLVAVLRGDPAQAADILSAARAQFGPLKAPRAVIWLQDWPELPSGKTDFQSLARQVGI